MRVTRSYLVRVVQTYDGDTPDDGDTYDEMDQDQYVCDNWHLIREEFEPVDDDQLEPATWRKDTD